MKAFWKGLPILVLLALPLTPAPANSPLPDPHQAMNAPESCGDCHEYDGEAPDPHEFFVAIPEKCWECHTQKSLGRSHPIGVDPRHSPAGVVDVPRDLPLEDGEVSCGTCHNPHLAFLSKTQAYLDQPATVVPGRRGETWYKTLYLRMSDPVEGFEPLCLACHRDF